MVYISQDCDNGDAQSLAFQFISVSEEVSCSEGDLKGRTMSLNHCITG